jgi:MFS family permease
VPHAPPAQAPPWAETASWPAVTMASVAAGMVALNASMVAVLVPTLAGEFAVQPAAGAWLVAVYLVVTTVLQPLTGRLGDLAGRRRVLLAGLVGFGLASALVAAAPAWRCCWPAGCSRPRRAR